MHAASIYLLYLELSAQSCCYASCCCNHGNVCQADRWILPPRTRPFHFIPHSQGLIQMNAAGFDFADLELLHRHQTVSYNLYDLIYITKGLESLTCESSSAASSLKILRMHMWRTGPIQPPGE